MSEPTNLAHDPVPDSVADTVPSPCVSLCKMDVERRYCMGCLRTIEEIVNWSKADDDYKRKVWAEIGRRQGVIAFDEDGFQR